MVDTSRQPPRHCTQSLGTPDCNRKVATAPPQRMGLENSGIHAMLVQDPQEALGHPLRTQTLIGLVQIPLLMGARGLNMLHHVLLQGVEAKTPHIEIALQTTLVGGANQKYVLESENARHEVGDITTPHHSEQPELGDDLVQ